MKFNPIVVLIILVAFFFICYAGATIHIHKEKQLIEMEEGFDNDVPETAYTNIDPNQVYYIYWTGGFDSTYRLIEMLVNEGKIVQPIYVSIALDNDCASEDTCRKLWFRRNRKEEKAAMKKIKKMIQEKFPYTKKTLLPTLEVDKPIEDDQFNLMFEKKFYSNNLWPAKRKKHQYLFLSKYAYYHKKPIDIGVLGIHEKSKFAHFLRENLIKQNNNYMLKPNNHALSYLYFPLYGRTKEQLLQQSKESRFDDILAYTWSCWFPKNSHPCGKCPMCRERVLPHPDNLMENNNYSSIFNLWS